MGKQYFSVYFQTYVKKGVPNSTVCFFVYLLREVIMIQFIDTFLFDWSYVRRLNNSIETKCTHLLQMKKNKKKNKNYNSTRR